MATQTGSIDLKAAKKAHDEAKKVATNYVMDISNGVFVHPEDDDNNGVQITDQVEIIRSPDGINKTAVAQFGELVRIGVDSNGYSRIIIDPTYSSSGISNIYSVIASTPRINYSVQANRIVLNDNNLSNGVKITNSFNPFDPSSILEYFIDLPEFPDEYDSSQPISDNFTIPEAADLHAAKEFSIGVTLRVYEYDMDLDPPALSVSTQQMTFNRIKGTSHNTSTDIKGFNLFNSQAHVDVALGYDGNSTFTLWVSTSQSHSSISRYQYSGHIYISELSYFEDGILIPIHQLNGDIYACASQDIETGDYTALGAFFIGLEVDSAASSSTPAASGDDMDLFNAILNMDWYDDVIE